MPQTTDFLDMLYTVRDDERKAFAGHWTGPRWSFKKGERIAIANYEPMAGGQSVIVFAAAEPARTYLVSTNDYRLKFSGERPYLVATIAEMLANGSLEIEDYE